MAVNGCFDYQTTKYSADVVYAVFFIVCNIIQYKKVLTGLRVYGKGMNSPSCDASLSYVYKKEMILGCSVNNLMETIGLSIYYKPSKTVKMGVTSLIKPGSGEVPAITVGIKYKPAKKTVIRGKINEKGLMSAVIKTELEKKVTFTGCIMADIHDFTASNRASIGVELVF